MNQVYMYVVSFFRLHIYVFWLTPNESYVCICVLVYLRVCLCLSICMCVCMYHVHFCLH